MLCGLEGAAAGEDGQASEQPLLVLVQEIVAPGDRRPQGLLACFRVAATFEQVEALGEALDDLLGREDARSCSCQLDRKRQSNVAQSEDAELDLALLRLGDQVLRDTHPGRLTRRMM